MRFNAVTVLVFLSYLFAVALISLDDVAQVLNLQMTLPEGYWIAVEWFYPIYSGFAFFVFGRRDKLEKIVHHHASS